MGRTLTETVKESISSAQEHLGPLAENKWVDGGIVAGLAVAAIASRGKLSEAIEGLFPKAAGLLEKDVIANESSLMGAAKSVDLRGVAAQPGVDLLESSTAQLYSAVPVLTFNGEKSELGDSTAAAISNMFKLMPPHTGTEIPELKFLYYKEGTLKFPPYNSVGK